MRWRSVRHRIVVSSTLYHAGDEDERGSRVYPGGIPWDRMYFDADGEAVLPVPGPGTYFVVPRVYVDSEDNVGRGGALGLTPGPRIEVLELSEVQTFPIAIPQPLVDATVRRFVR
ncbi:MAG: hypothetical protein E2O39_16445 [Planctomycetota bacterium]|nr:MAG: hypothetical protein E2O39_16445 [Planctomycetota bacterium]